MSRRDLYI